MKKILLSILFISTTTLFADYKIISNDVTYCTNKVIDNPTDSDYINFNSRRSGSYGPATRNVKKDLITFIETGYAGYDLSCVRDSTFYPVSYDLYNEIREVSIDTAESSLNTKLKNSTNITNDVYIMDFKNSLSPICTLGKAYSDRYSTNYYTIDNQSVSIDNVSNINKVFYNANFNKDLNTCSYPSENSPVDLSSYFKDGEAFSNQNGISPKILALTQLFKTKNDLPNQNSLENKFDIDTTSSSLNCNSTAYSLQEKLLCEMNAGLRKLNQESNPKYSLNNLISILITSNDKNAQDTNESIKSISAFEEVRLQKQKETNALLDSTIFKQSEINSTLSNIETTLKGIETNTTGGIVSGGGSSGGTVTPEPEKIDLDKYLKPDENINLDDLNNINNDTDSIITTLFTSFTDFKTNITDSVDSINNQLDGLKETIENPTNIFTKNTIINCPVTYKADFSSFGLGQKSLIVDYCEFTSRLQPIVYFFTYVTLLIGLIFFSFRFIGVLL